MKINDKNISRIKELCEEYMVRTLAAFDSVTRDDFGSASNIDFVVDFNKNDPFTYTDLYFQLKEGLNPLLSGKSYMVT